MAGLVHFGAREYDPQSGQWTTADPIGFAGGSANLYSYASLDPINRTDADGKQVAGIYDKKTGILTVRDIDTGEQVSIRVESGGKPFGDPIPNGSYDILERAGREDFFRLDKIDRHRGDDKDDVTGRTSFRLHKPGRTVGCIAAKDVDEWRKLRSLIERTRTTQVMDNAAPPWRLWNTPAPITKYGTLTVR